MLTQRVVDIVEPAANAPGCPKQCRALHARGRTDFTIAVARTSMIRSQLIARLAQQRDALSLGDIEAAVKTMLEHMAGHLAGGGRIEIRGFGSLTLRHHRARIARNPRTGEPVARPASHVVHFKPGKALRERVDARGAHKRRGK